MKPSLRNRFLNHLSPILTQAKIMGQVTHKKLPSSISGVQQTFNYARLWSLVIAILFTALVCHAWRLFTHSPVGSLLKTTCTLNFGATIIQKNIIWLSAILNDGQGHTTILNELIKFDTHMEQNGGASTVGNYDKFGRKILVEMTARHLLCGLNLGISVWHNLSQDRLPSGWADLFAQFEFVFDSTFNHYFIVIVTMIGIRFKLLNRELYKLSHFHNRSRAIATIVVGTETKAKTVSLVKIAEMHHLLTKIIHGVNETFGFMLLVTFGVFFLKIVIVLFYLSVFFQIGDVMLIVRSLIDAGLLVFDLVYLCGICHSTVMEAKKSGRIIHKIHTDDHGMMAEIEMFTLQILNDQTEFSAFGFFKIDYDLLFSTFGGITTYLIILIQTSASVVVKKT